MVIRNPFSSKIVHQIQEIIEPYVDEIKEKSNAKYDPDWKNNLSIKSLFSVIDYEVPKSNNNNLSKISVDKPAKKIEKIINSLFPDLYEFSKRFHLSSKEAVDLMISFILGVRGFPGEGASR